MIETSGFFGFGIVRKAALAATIVAGVMMGSGAALQAADDTFITVGTGGVTGVYYQAGGLICAQVNAGRKDHGVRCSVESTGGSLYNINAIREGDLDVGFAQSDWQYHAYKGTAKFKKAGPFDKMRALFSLHPEPFTVVARADAGIATFEDLKGKRVNIGNPGSGQRATMEVLMEAYGWTKRDFALAAELKSAEQSRALCDNKIDAIVFTVGHPSGSIQEATTLCETVLVPVEGPIVAKLIEENSFYGPAIVPGGMYTGNANDVATFGVAATVITSADLPEAVAYQVTRSVFERFKRFSSRHPALQVLKKENMVRNNLSAPLHEGAARYYREVGLIE